MVIGKMLARALLACLSLLPGTTAPHAAGEAGKSAQCEAVAASRHEVEAAARATLAQIHRYRDEAERLADWYGRERFAPYIDTLRLQERALAAQLEDIRAMQCQPAPADPFAR